MNDWKLIYILCLWKENHFEMDRSHLSFLIWPLLTWIVVLYSTRLVVYWDSAGIYMCLSWHIHFAVSRCPWSFIYLSVCIISAKVICERKPLWWILINDAFHDLSSFIRGMLLVLHVNSMIININLLVFNFHLPLKADSKPFSNLLVKSFIIKQWN